MKNFQIIEISNTPLVIILSYELLEYYWEDLQKALSVFDYNTVIYFDFLYRNGLHNRFFSTRKDFNGIRPNTIRACNVSVDIMEASEKYFMTNPHLINNSAMTSTQKKFWLRKFHSKWNKG